MHRVGGDGVEPPTFCLSKFPKDLGFPAQQIYFMPRPATFPTLCDKCKTVCISFLKQHGYLQPNQHKAGVITWSNQSEKTGSISISVYIELENSYLQLDYLSNAKPISYKVELVPILSNLGKGLV